jgi:hypothetical protein
MNLKPPVSVPSVRLSARLLSHHLQVLPIPELVPFRLTPQLLGALQPHSGREVLAPAMAAALAALSAPAARQLLGAVMEVRHISSA